MDQFDYDNLMIIAGTMEMTGEGKPADVRRAYLRCAKMLRDHLQRLPTSPGPAPSSEPPALPPIGSPRVPTFTEWT